MEISKHNIDELLVAYLLNELEETTRSRVKEWIHASEENRNQYVEVERIWSGAEPFIAVNTDQAWRKIAPSIKSTKTGSFYFLRIAASLVFLVSVSLVLFNVLGSSKQTTISAMEYAVEESLEDGSIVTLNTNSDLNFDKGFNKKDRKVRLTGEAFFDIKRDPEKPFIIETGDCQIEVLGTSFNVNSYPQDDQVIVVVHSGLVAFSYPDEQNNTKTIKLSKNQKAVYHKRDRKLELTQNNTSNQVDLYWLKKSVVYDNSPLNEVTLSLEEIFDVNIVIQDSVTQHCQLTASFEQENVVQIMEVISSTFGLELQKMGNEFVLKGKACADH